MFILKRPNTNTRYGTKRRQQERPRDAAEGPARGGEVTRRPQALRTTPTLLAVTPLPSPLTTPPVISTYLVAAAGCSSPAGTGAGGEDMRPEEEGGRCCAALRFRGEGEL
nr:unnamed protein product [Digitaria exilis]